MCDIQTLESILYELNLIRKGQLVTIRKFLRADPNASRVLLEAINKRIYILRNAINEDYYQAPIQRLSRRNSQNGRGRSGDRHH